MNNTQKIIVGVLLVGTVLFWIAAFTIPKFLLNNKAATNQSTQSQNAKAEPKEYPMADIQQRFAAALPQAEKYANDTLKPAYKPKAAPLQYAGYNLKQSLGLAAYGVQPWTIDNNLIKVMFYTTLVGDKYSQDNLPVRYEVILRQENTGNTIDNLFKHVQTYYAAPALADFDNPKKLRFATGGEALEVSWKNDDNSIEARSVYSPSGDSAIYFIACRILPIASSYDNGSCYEELSSGDGSKYVNKIL